MSLTRASTRTDSRTTADRPRPSPSGTAVPPSTQGATLWLLIPRPALPLTTDQRGAGFPRIVGKAVDFGAYEFQATTFLVVTTQPPSSVTAGSGFGFTVTAEDHSGNLLTSFNGTVTVALLNNPGGSTLGGTLSVTAQNGVATFSDLTLNKTGTAYTLLVSGTGLAGATTNDITVTPAAASQLVVSSQPPGSVLVGSGFGLVVTAEDPFDNVDTNFGGSVAVALFSNPGGATLGGTVSVTAQYGVATFSGLTLDRAWYRLYTLGHQQRPVHGDHQRLQRDAPPTGSDSAAAGQRLRRIGLRPDRHCRE